ncbi:MULTISPECIES: hypothetical protein [Bacillus]|uniref:hypothetical protein n=1 Tax=Bacillus paralicheniformis TaxID=1648923 RepID=UPI003981C636
MQLDFPWYKIKNKDEDITQGDIILSCPVPVIDYDEDYPYFKPQYMLQDVIVMTQACDLENNKVRNVTLCKIGSLEKQVKEHFDYRNKDNKGYNYETISPRSKFKYAKEIIQGKYLDLYFLNKFDNGQYKVPYRLVYLRDSYKIPVHSLKKFIESKEDSEILSLLPPYREHLSQHFSFNFSRIGLPVNIALSEEEF